MTQKEFVKRVESKTSASLGMSAADMLAVARAVAEVLEDHEDCNSEIMVKAGGIFCDMEFEIEQGNW